jgi:hypothetical protein
MKGFSIADFRFLIVRYALACRLLSQEVFSSRHRQANKAYRT